MIVARVFIERTCVAINAMADPTMHAMNRLVLPEVRVLVSADKAKVLLVYMDVQLRLGPVLVVRFAETTCDDPVSCICVLFRFVRLASCLVAWCRWVLEACVIEDAAGRLSITELIGRK